MNESPIVLTPKPDKPEDLWAHDLVQFARLITELGTEAQVFSPRVMNTLKREMDLTEDQIHTLISRAQRLWDHAKQGDYPAVRQDDSTEDFVLLESHPGVWITVNNISVRVIRADECVVVDLYPKGREMDGPLGSTFASYAEADYKDISVIGMKQFTELFGATTDLSDDEAVEARAKFPDRFWTMVTGDGGDGLVPGSQWVDRYGFCLSERPRTPEQTEEIQWVDLTGPCYAIVCTNPECDSFEEESTTYSAIDNDDGTFTCCDCEGPNRLKPGRHIDGIA